LSGDLKAWASVSAVLEQFGKKRGKAIRTYRKFIFVTNNKKTWLTPFVKSPLD
jgi:hypothetical protein